MNLTLSVAQRFKLEQHINQKRDVGHKALRTLWDVADKIALTPEETNDFFAVAPNGDLLFKAEAFATAKDVEFSTAELREIKALLDKAELTGADRKWVPGLTAQLKDIE